MAAAAVFSMAPRRRKQDDPPPEYGADEMKFSVEVHHGGVFYGSGQNRAYIDGKVDWWDHVDAMKV